MKSILLLSFSLVPFYGWFNWGVERIRALQAASQCQSWDVHSRRGQEVGWSKKDLAPDLTELGEEIHLTHTHTHTHTQHARAQAQYWSNSIRWWFSSVSVPQNHLEACGNRSGQAHSPEFLPQVWCRWAGALRGGPLSGSRAVRVSIWKCSHSKYEQAHLEKAGTLTGCLCGTMSHLNMLAKGRKTSAQAD